MPLVYVIIVNFNGMKWLEACLKSVLATDYEPFKVIVVDNASVDGSVEYIKACFPEVELISNSENLGFCEGNNIAIRAAVDADADYFLLLNTDTIVTKTWLTELVAAGEENESLGVLGAVQLDYRGDDFNWWTKTIAKKYLRELAEPASARQWIPMPWVEGSCFAMKRKVVGEVGMLDPIYFMYFEEMDFCRRALAHGFDVGLVPRSRYHHFGSGSSRTKEAQLFQARMYDRSHLIYRLSDLRSSFARNILRSVMTVGLKCYEQIRKGNPSRIWTLVGLQFDIARSLKSIRQKWKVDRSRLNDNPRLRSIHRAT